MRALVLLSCAVSAFALRFQYNADTSTHDDNIKCTTIGSIDDKEWSAPDMLPVKHKDFNVSVVVYANTPDIISEEMKQKGEWDGDVVKAICTEFIKYGGRGNIFDIGGNIGTYTLPLAACLKENGKGTNRVISIEGAPWNAKHLRAGIKYNHLDNIDLYEYAVGSPNEPRVVKMRPHGGNQGMSHVQFERKPVAVKLTTIDTIGSIEGAPLQNIFVMKVDIEGHEKKAFEGAANFFKNGPCIIWIEMQHSSGLDTILEDYGYVVNQTNDGNKNAWCTRKDFDQCIAKLV